MANNTLYIQYKNILFRKRFCKRALFVAVVSIAVFYSFVLFFGDLRSPVMMRLTDLERCPACYGVSLCPELYSNQINMDTNQWAHIFNAKNVYYGTTKTNKQVVMKKLAHDWELKEFDSNLCKSWNFQSCRPIDLINTTTDVHEKIVKIVSYNFTWPELEPRNGLIMCPYAYSIMQLLQPILNSKTHIKSELINIWTMLSINPEPIILQIISKTNGWPVPAWGGVCGRLEIVGNEGKPLSALSPSWHQKLSYSLQILNAAMDFTFKHDRFRFYLLDWSLDNIVANEKGDITFVDLEDILVIDKSTMPGKDLPHWYKRYNHEVGPGFSFSIENMCQHHWSDHNLWAACYIIAGNENPLLYPIPEDVKFKPHLNTLLHECINNDNRIEVVGKLQIVMKDILEVG